MYYLISAQSILNIENMKYQLKNVNTGQTEKAIVRPVIILLIGSVCKVDTDEEGNRNTSLTWRPAAVSDH